LRRQATAVYAIKLPDGSASAWELTRDSSLVFSVAALDEDAPLLNEKEGEKDEKKPGKPEAKKERESPDLSIELETSDGIIASRPLSQFGTILPL